MNRNFDQVQAPRRRRRGLLIAGLTLLATLLIAALAAVIGFGPRFGFWLIKPSPRGYADYVVRQLDSGYYATGELWDAARAQLLTAAQDAESYADLYEAIAAATKAAGGKHSFFLIPEQAAASDQSAVAGYTPPSLVTTGGITTITLPALGGVSPQQQQDYADAAAHGIRDAAPSTCGWIIDLRGNTGGNMYPMIAGVAALLPDGPAMSFESRTGEAQVVQIGGGGLGFGAGPVLKTDVLDKVSGQHVAVLYDGLTASSGEAVATVFRGLEGVRAFGTPTAGYSSANSGIKLPDGALLVLTQGVYVDRAGVNLNEEPIQPDELTSAADAPAAAQAWLRQGSCG